MTEQPAVQQKPVPDQAARHLASVSEFVTFLNVTMSSNFILPALLLYFPFAATCQERPQDGRDTLDRVVVTAGHLQKKRTEAPVSISQLSYRELNETRAATPAQLLNKAAGVFAVNLGNEQHSMSIRQPLSFKSLFLYLEDGIPIRPAGVFNHNALIEMNMAALEEIEVVKGPASASYGSDAIGGSINFLSGEAPPRPEAWISVRGDNQGYRRLDLKAGGSLPRGKHGLQANGYYAYRRHGLQEHSDFDKLALSLRSEAEIATGSRLTTSATIVNYLADMTGAVDSVQFYSRNYPSPYRFTYREVKALRVRSTLDRQWVKGHRSQFTLLYRNNLIGQNPSYRIRNEREDSSLASGELNENTFQSYGGIFQHSLPINSWNSTLAAGFSLDYSPVHYRAEYIRVERDPSGNYVDYRRVDSLLTDYRVGMLNAGFYAQWESRPFPRLNLSAALRYDRFAYDYTNALPPGAFSGAPDSRDLFGNLSPKFGLTYDLGKGRGLYANFSTGFVPPQVTELYRGIKVPVLEPSIYRNYEGGAWFAFPGGNLEVSVYRLEGINEIISVQMDDGTTENRNAGQTLHQGIEYALTYRISGSFRMRLGGTTARHTYLSYTEGTRDYSGNEMDAAPAWLANSEMVWYPAFANRELLRTHLALEWQHMSPYYMDPANTERYEGFDVLNFRAGMTRGKVSAWFHLLNLTDALYATHSAKSAYGKRYSAGAPRAVSLGIGYRLQ